MAVGTAAAIGLGMSAVGTGMSAAFGGGGGGGARLEMPPELMMNYIQQSQQQLQMLNQQYQKVQYLEQNYNQQLDVINEAIKGSMPTEEAVKSLQDQTLKIGQALGMSAKELAENGFMSEESAQQMQSLQIERTQLNLERAGLDKERASLLAERGVLEGQLHGLEDERQAMAAMIGQESDDPELLRKQSEQRSQLEQELRRSGVKGAQLQRELSRFDQMAREERVRFGRQEFEQHGQIYGMGVQQYGLGQQQLQAGQSLLQQGQAQLGLGYQGLGLGSQLLGQQLSGEAQGVQSALGLAGAQQSALDRLFDQRAAGIGGQTAIASTRFGAGMQSAEMAQRAAEAQQGIYGQLGQYKYSGDVKKMLETGVIGPGTAKQQTGIARGRELDRSTQAFRSLQGKSLRGYDASTSSTKRQEDLDRLNKAHYQNPFHK